MSSGNRRTLFAFVITACAPPSGPIHSDAAVSDSAEEHSAEEQSADEEFALFASTRDFDGDGVRNEDDRCDGRDYGGVVALGASVPTSTREVIVADLTRFVPSVSGLPTHMRTVTASSAPQYDGGCSRSEVLHVVLTGEPGLASLPAGVRARIERLATGSREGYVLASGRSYGTWIIAASERGLLHGTSAFLVNAGVRFLMPGDVWTDTLVANHNDIRRVTLTYAAPTFSTMGYFGTGGIHRNEWLSCAPPATCTPAQRARIEQIRQVLGGYDGQTHTGEHETLVNTWRRRRAFPSGRQMPGHSWEDFMLYDPNPGNAASVRDRVDQQVADNPSMRACFRLHYPANCVGLADPALNACQSAIAVPQDAMCGDRGTGSELVHFRRAAADSDIINPTHYANPPAENAAAFSPAVPTTGLVELFRRWSVEERLPSAMQTADPSQQPVVSVDPADSAQYCECDKCRAMHRHDVEGVAGNPNAMDAHPSNSMFHLSNVVARSVRASAPNALVGILAYSGHALPPSFPVDRNTLVLVAPYAFHQFDTGMRGDEMIGAWTQKRDAPAGGFELGAYDYWGYTSVALDEPQITPEFVLERLRNFRQHGLLDFVAESTVGSGAGGLAWYLASHFAWYPDADYNAVVAEWFSRAFGPAAAMMREFFRVLHARNVAGGYINDPWSLQTCWTLLETARLAVADADNNTFNKYEERLAQIRGYLRHVENVRAWRNEPSQSTLNELLLHAYRLAPTGMVHSNGIRYGVDSGLPAGVSLSSWSFAPVGSAWKNFPGFYSIAEMAALQSSLPSNLMPLDPPAAASIQPSNLERFLNVSSGYNESTSSGRRNHGVQTYVFYAEANQAITFQVITTGAGAGLPGTRRGRVTVTTPSGLRLPAVYIPVETQGEQTVDRSFTTPNEAGVYTWTYDPSHSERATFYFNYGMGNCRVLPGESSEEPYFGQYFWVPRGTRRFAVLAENGVSDPRFFTVANSTIFPPENQTQTPVPAVRFGRLFMVNVPAGQAATVWRLEGFQGRYGFLNLPNLVANHPHQLLIPHGTR